MTTDEALKEVQNYVQWMREGNESDLRSVLHHIKYMRKELAEGREPKPFNSEEV